MRSPHAFHRTPLSVSLISSVCFQRQLLQLRRPPTTSLSAALDSSKSSSVSTPWHCQCPHPTPRRTDRGRASQGPPPSPRPQRVHRVTPFSNSSASLLSLCFVARIVAPVCHHMANGYPQQKERGESEEVGVQEKKGKKKKKKKKCITIRARLRDQQKHHSCSRTRQRLSMCHSASGLWLYVGRVMSKVDRQLALSLMGVW